MMNNNTTYFNMVSPRHSKMIERPMFKLLYLCKSNVSSEGSKWRDKKGVKIRSAGVVLYHLHQSQVVQYHPNLVVPAVVIR